jgi:hypothetical protein
VASIRFFRSLEIGSAAKIDRDKNRVITMPLYRPNK